MARLATAEQMRRLDHIAIVDRNIPSIQLMETAARAVAEEALKLLPNENRGQVAVFCGPGNNGGDGLAAARFLQEKGVFVRAFLVGERRKMTEDSQEMERRLAQKGVKLEDFTSMNQAQEWLETCDLIIDAIFGIGLHSEVKGLAAAAIAVMKKATAMVLSVDIPSGVNADSGEVLGIAANAVKTITFTLSKAGLCVGEGAVCSGEVIVVSIGIPDGLLNAEQFDTFCTEPPILPPRQRDTHKGNYGKILVYGGCRGYTGAPAFSANAAVRCGSGLVFLAVPEDIYEIEAIKCNEAMVSPLSLQNEELLAKGENCSAVLIGPGLGNSTRSQELTMLFMEQLTKPLVVDADGINILSMHIDSLDNRQGMTVLTPHDGEFARLNGGIPVGKNRLETARQFAVTHGCILVLKGHRTITAFPDGVCFINPTGNPGMAKGGSGDVLSGMIVSLLGQGIPAKTAVPAAVYLHGRAGDLCAQQLGEYGMTPSDMIRTIPNAILNPI